MTPETLIASPGSNDSTVTVSPTASGALATELDEVAVRPDAGLLRWPTSGFESFRSATASNASWTAS